jgi:hypothetical protein
MPHINGMIVQSDGNKPHSWVTSFLKEEEKGTFYFFGVHYAVIR